MQVSTNSENSLERYKLPLIILSIVFTTYLLVQQLLNFVHLDSHIIEAIFISGISGILIWKYIIIPQKKILLNKFNHSVSELGDDIHAIDHLAVISACDMEGKIVYANDNFCRISGYSRGELLGQDHKILNSGFHPKGYFKNAWNCLQSGIPWEGVVRNKKKNGEFYWVNSYCVPIFDENKIVTKYVSFRFDITEQKVAESKLKEISNESEAILRSARYAIITTNTEGTITGFNHEAEAILGYKAEEVVNKYTPDIFHNKDEIIALAKTLHVPAGFEVFKYKANRGEVDERQWTYVKNDGAEVQVKLNVTALYGSDGALYGYMGIAKDISAEIETKKQLDHERAKTYQNAKLASIGEMAACIAHEINNPLSVISSTLPLLDKFKDNPEKFHNKIEACERSVIRMNKIIGRLKKFTHNTEQEDCAKLHLAGILDETIALVENKATVHGVKLEIAQKCDGHILCYEIEIEQVLINLINNAIDAVKELEDKWVKIHIMNEEHELILRVIDSGRGIPEDIETQLFNPFFTTKKIGEGTGLGLSIVKEILERHNTSIAINRDEKNTCFELRFPLYVDTLH
jgi:PAS domain S-box-containing protein